MTGAAITGIGVAVPSGILSNAELSRRAGVDEEWIVQRTGIHSRHVAAESDTTSSLATDAARKALDHARLTPNDVDMVICATVTPDYQFPATASVVQNNLGISGAGAFDLMAGCSGWLYAAAQARSLVESGAADNVLVCGAEILSRVVDYDDYRSCVLFGDGAGATVISRVEGETDFGPFVLRSDGSQAELLWIPPDSPFIKMRGREVYKYAVDGMTKTVSEVLEAGGITPDERTLLVGHQANARILEAVTKRLGWRRERAFLNVEEYGNTSSASIPIALEEAWRTGVLRADDLVVVTAFGAGFAWGAGTLRWRIPSPVETDAAAKEVARV